jgi:hypothetical protein
MLNSPILHARNRKYEWSLAIALLLLSVSAVFEGHVTAASILFVACVATSIYLKVDSSQARAAAEAYVQTVLGDEVFEPLYEQGHSLAVKVGISARNRIVLLPRQAMDNLPLLTKFLNAKASNDHVAMVRAYELLNKL